MPEKFGWRKTQMRKGELGYNLPSGQESTRTEDRPKDAGAENG
jgi:hypothetical protein